MQRCNTLKSDSDISRVAVQLSRALAYEYGFFVDQGLYHLHPYLSHKVHSLFGSGKGMDSVISTLYAELSKDDRMFNEALLYVRDLSCGLTYVKFTSQDLIFVDPRLDGLLRNSDSGVEVRGQDDVFRLLRRSVNTSIKDAASDAYSLTRVGVKSVDAILCFSQHSSLFSAILSTMPFAEWQISGRNLYVRVSSALRESVGVPSSVVSVELNNPSYSRGQGSLSCLLVYVRGGPRCSCLTFRSMIPYYSKFSYCCEKRCGFLSQGSFSLCSEASSRFRTSGILPCDIHRLFSGSSPLSLLSLSNAYADWLCTDQTKSFTQYVLSITGFTCYLEFCSQYVPYYSIAKSIVAPLPSVHLPLATTHSGIRAFQRLVRLRSDLPPKVKKLFKKTKKLDKFRLTFSSNHDHSDSCFCRVSLRLDSYVFVSDRLTITDQYHDILSQIQHSLSDFGEQPCGISNQIRQNVKKDCSQGGVICLEVPSLKSLCLAASEGRVVYLGASDSKSFHDLFRSKLYYAFRIQRLVRTSVHHFCLYHRSFKKSRFLSEYIIGEHALVIGRFHSALFLKSSSDDQILDSISVGIPFLDAIACPGRPSTGRGSFELFRVGGSFAYVGLGSFSGMCFSGSLDDIFYECMVRGFFSILQATYDEVPVCNLVSSESWKRVFDEMSCLQ